MNLLMIIAYIVAGGLMCGILGIGISVNHNYDTKNCFIVGSIIGVIFTIAALIMGLLPPPW
jgi:hypothetical protein